MSLVSSKNKNNTVSKKPTLISAAPQQRITGSTILPTDIYNKLHAQSAVVKPNVNNVLSAGKQPLNRSADISNVAYYQPILDVIRKGEARTAGYNQMVNSNSPHGLTKKTLKQVMDYQNEWLKSKKGRGTAAGAYQFLSPTLKQLAAQHKHDLNKTIFDEKIQDLYGRSLMDRRGFKDYLSGKINADQMRMNLAKEWAALPAAGEKSYYEGKGTNRATVSSKELNAAIAKSLELYKQSLNRQRI